MKSPFLGSWMGPILGSISSVWASEPLSVSDALARAYSSNPEIAAQSARAEAESSLVRSRYWLSNPRVGLMREVAMNNMQQEMGPMTSWSVSQEVMFPLKYFAMGSAQSARSQAATQEYLDKKLEVRQRVLTSYYGLYAAYRIQALLEAQKETLREIARIAESKRATGAAPQQDEMKAHVEQTRLENEILLQKQEIVEAQSRLNALLDQDPSEEILLPQGEISSPKLKVPSSEIAQLALAQSRSLAAQAFMVEESEHERRLAKYGYLPDFMLSYRKPYTNSPSNAYAASIEVSIPLWFFMKQTSEVSAASARALQAEKNLEVAKRATQAEARSMASKVETYEKLLKIYETALIPQATSTLNSSRAAYGAGRTGFFELLDSERSLYSVRISYYQTLAKFVESLSQLERVAGSSLSSLPFGESP